MTATTVAANAALLSTLHTERERWEALIAGAGPERLTTSGVCGDQSLKDLLGHLTAYTRRWGAELHGNATGTQPTIGNLVDVDVLPLRIPDRHPPAPSPPSPINPSPTASPATPSPTTPTTPPKSAPGWTRRKTG